MTEDEIVYRSFCDLNAPGYGLLANYSFNQGYSNYNNNTETTVYDSSNNLYNATLINFALQEPHLTGLIRELLIPDSLAVTAWASTCL